MKSFLSIQIIWLVRGSLSSRLHDFLAPSTQIIVVHACQEEGTYNRDFALLLPSGVQWFMQCNSEMGGDKDKRNTQGMDSMYSSLQ